jgi:hypothetical protein
MLIVSISGSQRRAGTAGLRVILRLSISRCQVPGMGPTERRLERTNGRWGPNAGRLDSIGGRLDRIVGGWSPNVVDESSQIGVWGPSWDVWAPSFGDGPQISQAGPQTPAAGAQISQDGPQTSAAGPQTFADGAQTRKDGAQTSANGVQTSGDQDQPPPLNRRAEPSIHHQRTRRVSGAEIPARSSPSAGVTTPALWPKAAKAAAAQSQGLGDRIDVSAPETSRRPRDRRQDVVTGRDVSTAGWW